MYVYTMYIGEQGEGKNKPSNHKIAPRKSQFSRDTILSAIAGKWVFVYSLYYTRSSRR